MNEARRSLQDSPVNFFAVDPATFWFDFAISLVLAYGSASIFLFMPLGSWQQAIAFPIAVFWLYRLGSLVHEVAHLSHEEMQPFKVAWNLLAGVVILSPSPFFTRHHRDHHSQRLYGKLEDPEYVVNVFAPGSLGGILFYALQIVIFPLVVFLRFLLVPFTYLHPDLREWVLVHASSLTLNWRYERRLTAQDRWSIAAVEWLCCLRAILMLAWVALGFTDWTRLVLFYSLALGVLVLNQMRQLGDHHFESHGEASDIDAHIRDSCNYVGHDPLTLLLFPFSIRFHALHHLVPMMPYHHLEAADAWLREKLPADSPYHKLEEKDWWSVARRTLWGGGEARVPSTVATVAEST